MPQKRFKPFLGIGRTLHAEQSNQLTTVPHNHSDTVSPTTQLGLLEYVTNLDTCLTTVYKLTLAQYDHDLLSNKNSLQE